MSKIRAIAIGGLLALAVIAATLWAADKPKAGTADQGGGGAKAKDSLAEEMKKDPAFWQANRMWFLESNYKGYEYRLRKGASQDAWAQALHKDKLAQFEKDFRDHFNEIVNLDPTSKLADEARKWMKKFESLKKYGPTM